MAFVDNFVNSLGNTLSGGVFGLVNSGLSMLGNAISNHQNRKLYELQWQRQKEQHDADLMFARQMWEDNNSYNAPVAQMARLRAAGLNPNLVYGSGSVVGNSSSPSNTSITNPSVSAPSMNSIAQGVNLGDMVTLGNANALNRAQVRNIEAEAKGKEIENAANEQTLQPLKMEQLGIARAQRDIADLEKDMKDLYYHNFYGDSMQVQIDQALATYNKTQSEITEIASRIELNDSQKEFLGSNIKLNDSKIEYIGSQTKLNNAQVDALKTRVSLEKAIQPYKIQLFEAQTKNYLASAKLTESQSREINYRVDNILPLAKKAQELSNRIDELKIKVLTPDAYNASYMKELEKAIKEYESTGKDLDNQIKLLQKDLLQYDVDFYPLKNTIDLIKVF